MNINKFSLRHFIIFLIAYILVAGSILLAQQSVPTEEKNLIKGGMDLLGFQEIRKELKLSESQKSQIDTILVRTSTKMRNLPRDKRASKMEEIYKNAEVQIDSILLPDQKKRLYQIELQVQGTRGLLCEDVRKKLELTDEQYNTIRKSYQEEKQTIIEQWIKYKDIEQAKQAINKLKKENIVKINAILTKDQRDQAYGFHIELPPERWKKR
jgi:hypothetical protein